MTLLRHGYLQKHRELLRKACTLYTVYHDPWILPLDGAWSPVVAWRVSTINQSITRFCNQRCSLARIRSLRTHLKMGPETSHPKKAQSDLKIAHIRISRVTYILDIDSQCPYLLSVETTFQLTSCQNSLYVYLRLGETTSHLTSKWRGTFQYFQSHDKIPYIYYLEKSPPI